MTRGVKAVTAFLISFGLFAVPLSPVSAQKFNPENKIYVQGRIAPVHSVIVDARGVVIEIVSNTTEDATPRVFRNSITKENQIELTADVQKQYSELVPKGTSKVGVLYKQPRISIDLDSASTPEIFEPFADR